MDRCSAAVYGADDKKFEVKSLKRLTFDWNYCDIEQCAETRGGKGVEQENWQWLKKKSDRPEPVRTQTLLPIKMTLKAITEFFRAFRWKSDSFLAQYEEMEMGKNGSKTNF